MCFPYWGNMRARPHLGKLPVTVLHLVLVIFGLYMVALFLIRLILSKS